MSKNTICPACGNEYGQGFATMDPDLDCLPCAMYLQGKREGIEAAAQVADAYRREDNTILVSAAEYIATRIRALLQTEEKKP